MDLHLKKQLFDLFNSGRIEPLLAAIHEDVEKAGGDYWQKRRAVAHFFGYEDAKFIVRHLFSTLGFPLEESAVWVGRHKLELDKGGLRHEMLMLGVTERTVDLWMERMQDAHLIGSKEVTA